ncbi:MAG TPA: cofactor-independent phosphoglycerate mutase [Kiritimatiellae bacterium]|nr:cofactor-independent phosphoglycerate mutase [Kiritimatiellia bacterium]
MPEDVESIVFLVGDGMGDFPLEELDGRTPLQAARIPMIRRLAAAGQTYLMRTTPDGMYPGSDVANLSLLGYDPARIYTGRAPLEAAGAGITLLPDQVAFRCNLVTITGGVMEDYSAGHIGDEDAAELIAALKNRLDTGERKFHPGVGYRHLLVWKNGPADAVCIPPHDIAGQEVSEHFPRGPGADEIMKLMKEAAALLAAHPVNRRRVKAGIKPANSIWLWGAGRAVTLPSYSRLYGLSGGVVSAVDLVRGIGILAGLKAPRIPGATGFLDTDYDAKVRTALEMLEGGNFVYLHLEAPDECGHLGDARLKVTAIEAFDQRIVRPVLEGLLARGRPFRLLIGTDHRTPIRLRTHSPDPVPFLVYHSSAPLESAERPFDEFINNGRECGMAYHMVREYLQRSGRT